MCTWAKQGVPVPGCLVAGCCQRSPGEPGQHYPPPWRQQPLRLRRAGPHQGLWQHGPQPQVAAGGVQPRVWGPIVGWVLGRLASQGAGWGPCPQQRRVNTLVDPVLGTSWTVPSSTPQRRRSWRKQPGCMKRCPRWTWASCRGACARLCRRFHDMTWQAVCCSCCVAWSCHRLVRAC